VARALLALLLTAALSPAQARDALPVIDDCLDRLDATLDVGYARIAARCPELTPALRLSPWAAWLPADWNRADNQLSAAGLGELRTLLARAAAGEAARRPAPRTAQVGAVLAAVTHGDEAGSGWWVRFKGWLRQILAPHARADDGWLRRWLADLNLSTEASEIIAWSALALVVALAVAIVLSELRLAGWLGSGGARAVQGTAHARARATLSLEALGRAALAEQPALLLELIADKLVAQQRLPPARALTARELTRGALFPQESARVPLAELVTVCEHVRFSDQPVSAASLSAALHGGRRLLAMLEAPGRAAFEAS
jgi:hypothetical protein